MAGHNQLGKEGELLATAWLQANGFSILHRNWRFSYYEVDIIAVKDNLLHFIEVKARRNNRFGEPEESVHKKKMINLIKAGEAYQFQYPQWKRLQFDVLSISLKNDGVAEYFFIEDVYL